MKNTKKISRFLVVFVLIITLLVFPFSGCIGKSITLSFARNMQKNTNFEFCILTEITADISFEDYFIVPGFGVTGYVNKKYGEDYSSKEDINYVQYSVSSWPDVLSKKQYITGIHCYDENYNIYGLKIGDSAQKWEQTLTQKGFKLKDGRYYYSHIRINVNQREGVVFSFSIYADSTNISCVVF